MKTLEMMVAGSCFILLISSLGCIGIPHEDVKDYTVEELSLDEIHEWGLFWQDYNADEIFVDAGPRPGNPEYPTDTSYTVGADKPVIYLHGSGVGAISMSIAFNGSDIVTIPQANMVDDGINWNMDVAGSVSTGNAYPVDSNGTLYDYLFYEGRMKAFQDIRATVEEGNGSLRSNITNVNGLSIKDALLVHRDASGYHLSEVGDLDQGASFNSSIPLFSNGSIDDIESFIRTRMASRGLTSDEIDDFVDYWLYGEVDALGLSPSEKLFQNSDTEQVSLLYFISQEDYDSLLPMNVEITDGYQMQPSMARVGVGYLDDITIGHDR